MCLCICVSAFMRPCSHSYHVLFSSYRTLIRPSFKVTYKQVTALEWRCCPGFVGEECREGEFLCLFFFFFFHMMQLSQSMDWRNYRQCSL